MSPTTMEECRALQEWIEHGTDVALPTVDRDTLGCHLDFIASTLPSQGVDEETGKNRVAVFYRILGGYTEAAIAYMSRRVCAELDWFPTPHQCLKILADYPAPATDRDIAKSNCQWFLQEQMEAFLCRLQAGDVHQADIDAQPDQWKRIAENRWLLRQVGDRFVQRRKTIGPSPSDEPDHESEGAPAKAQPTVADYVALGLTEQDARDAIAERERLLRRGLGRTLAQALSAAA